LARQDWIGWLAIALIALAAFTASMIVIREIWALMRLSRLGRLRQKAARALSHGDKVAADGVAQRVSALYRHRDDLEWARSRLADHDNDIMNAAERLSLTERELMTPLDGQARAIVADAAKRVSVLTAISPIALIDIAFVAVQNMSMLRRLASLYGARPGGIGLFRLARMVVTHLVLTGGIAIGDDLLQQVIGHGVTAKLSARLGEGVVNGALTARIGIAAIDVCRPLPFMKGERPRIRDIVASLARP
jgi:putative membrane protein